MFEKIVEMSDNGEKNRIECDALDVTPQGPLCRVTALSTALVVNRCYARWEGSGGIKSFPQ